MKKYFLFILSLMIISLNPSYAWNNTGHEVIAQISYDHLTPATKAKIAAILLKPSSQKGLLYSKLSNFNNNANGTKFSGIYTHVLSKCIDPSISFCNEAHVKSRNKAYMKTLNHAFLLASTWPDYIKIKGIHDYDAWHFINLPFTFDSSIKQLPPVPSLNIVWAISKSASNAQQQMYLKFLIHLVGDIHQPLHDASLVSKKFPEGDEGGNLYPIISFRYQNLHQFWDDAGGLFYQQYPYAKLRDYEIKSLAHQIEQDYPQTNFTRPLKETNPMTWANEGLTLAKNDVYQIPENTQPSSAYIHQSQKIAEQQLALAGYRLAILLNHLNL